MGGIAGALRDLYIRLLVWLGAEPPPGYEYLLGAPAQPLKYTLKPGETLFSVARKFNIHYDRLAKANGIEKPNELKPGHTVMIPPAGWDPASGPLAHLQTPTEPVPVVKPPEIEKPAPVLPPEPAPPVIPPTVVEPAAPPMVEAAPPAPVEVVEPTPPPVEEIAPPPVQPEVPKTLPQTRPTAPVVPPAPEAPVIEPPRPTYEQGQLLPAEELVFRYEVQQGDTLNSISRRYGVTVEQLAAANALSEERLFAGQKLVIPGYQPDKPLPALPVEPEAPPPPPLPSDQFFIYTMTRGDTLNSIAKRYDVSVEQLMAANRIDDPAHIRVGQQLRIPNVFAPSPVVPTPVVEVEAAPPVEAVVSTFPAGAVRALYMSYFATGHPETRQRIFDLLERTELNAVVIDIKSDEGLLSYATQVPLAREIGADRPMAKDFESVLGQLKSRGVYTIARIVTFKDALLAKNVPEYGVKQNNPVDTLPDQEAMNWADPFLQPVWDYNIQIALEAAHMGFDEILFSQARFPSPTPNGTLQFSQEATREGRVLAVTGFLGTAKGQLQPLQVKVAADTLGYTCWRQDDSLIGQDIERMGPYVDVLCPMLYPSAFGSGIPGYKNAIAYPYEVVYQSAQRAVERLASFGCAVRPWIQDFPDYRFDKRVYGREEIQAQIKGCFDAGCIGYMVWDNRVKYTAGAYAPVTAKA
ncbi:MAG: putative glycoside hydrolase [Anaerolineae bacterium]